MAPLQRFEEDELRAARLLLEEEAQAMRAALGHPLLDPVDDAPVRCVARQQTLLPMAPASVALMLLRRLALPHVTAACGSMPPSGSAVPVSVAALHGGPSQKCRRRMCICSRMLRCDCGCASGLAAVD